MDKEKIKKRTEWQRQGRIQKRPLGIIFERIF
jgi:hypothetical protein